MKILRGLILAVLAAASQTAVTNAQEGSELESFVDGYFSQYMKADAIPGAVIVIVEGSETRLIKAYGVADVESGRPVSVTGTAFRSGSLGKMFTALAALQLVEGGELDLDAPVSQVLAEFAGLDSSVTLRRLLMHTAGFEDRFIGYQTRVGESYPDLAQHLEARMPPYRASLANLPAYSNYGYGLAGLMIERTASMPFRDYVAKEIFSPLGMEGAFYAVPPLDARAAALASEYASTGERQELAFTNPYPAGGAALTAQDMERFLHAFLDAWRGGTNAIGPAARLMTSPQYELLPGIESIGFGLNEQVIAGRRVWMKGGTAPRHSAVMLVMPEINTGIFIAVNRAEPIFWKRFFRAFITEFFPQTSPAPEAVGGERPATSDVEGFYQLNRANFSGIESIAAPLLQVRVSATPDGALRLEALIGDLVDSQIFRASEPGVWRTDRQFAAFAGADGQTMFINVDGDHVSLHRIAWWQRADMVMIGLAFAVLVILTFPLTRLAARLIARWRSVADRGRSVARPGHVLACATLILVAGAAVTVAGANALPFGPTLALKMTCAASVLFLGAASFAAWRLTAGTTMGGWTILRVHLAAAVLAAITLAALMLDAGLPLFDY